MAVRTPVYWDATLNSNEGGLRQMTSGQITEIVNQAAYQFSQNPSVTLNMSSGTASGIAGSASNLLSGFTLGSMGLGAAGLLGTIGGFLKTGLFAAIGIALADELGEYVEGLTGSQILGNMTEWAAIGGAAGFLFGPKFRIYLPSFQ